MSRRVSGRRGSVDKPNVRKALGRRRDEALFPAAPPRAETPAGYAEVLREIKGRVRQERLRTVLAANSAMVLLYWDIGRMILDRQDRAGWGARIVDRLACDLREAFPDMKGFSPRNLKYMRAFSMAWPDRGMVQQVAAQIPWFHNCVLLDRVRDPAEREWYVRQTVQQGWSRNILSLQIEGGAFHRSGKAITNFPATLPPTESDLAAQVFKDPYLFDFLGTADPRREREVEQALVNHIQRFLLLSAADDLLSHPDDKPMIGLLLCRSNNKIVVEYALRDLKKPIGVAQWETRIVTSLPRELKGSLPTVEEIEKELRDVD